MSQCELVLSNVFFQHVGLYLEIYLSESWNKILPVAERRLHCLTYSIHGQICGLCWYSCIKNFFLIAFLCWIFTEALKEVLWLCKKKNIDWERTDCHTHIMVIIYYNYSSRVEVSLFHREYAGCWQQWFV